MAVGASCSGDGGCDVGVQFLTTSPLSIVYACFHFIEQEHII